MMHRLVQPALNRNFFRLGDEGTGFRAATVAARRGIVKRRHQQLLRNPSSGNEGHVFFSTSTSSEEPLTTHLFSLIRLLPTRFLRDMATCNYDATTYQRTDVAFDTRTGRIPPTSNIPELAVSDPPSATAVARSAKYTIQKCVLDGSDYVITFGDGVKSRYSTQWVQATLHRCTTPPLFSEGRVLWSGWTESTVRQSTEVCVSFESLFDNDGMRHALQALYRYGILLILDTPVDDSGVGVAALAAAVSGGSKKGTNPQSSLWANYRVSGDGSPNIPMIVLPNGTDGPLRTLYGVVWSTSSSGQAEGSSIADSAYGHTGLPLHTDMTYHRDPPGLQIFTMRQPATSGGESVIADGFAVANRLKLENPSAFERLSAVVRNYCCIDHDMGWSLQAQGPIITVQNGTVTSIRHNDLDRLPDRPPTLSYNSTKSKSEAEIEFYTQLDQAHSAWDQLLSSDEFRLVVDLQPGDTMVVANQRCLHGRCGFEAVEGTWRSVMGCYVSQDELYSRFRMEGFDV